MWYFNDVHEVGPVINSPWNHLIQCLISRQRMAVLGVLAAVVVALLAAVLFVFVAYTVYLVIMHRRYAHIPQPKGAS